MKLTQADKDQFDAIGDMTFNTLRDLLHSQLTSETKPKAPLLVTAMVAASSRFIGNMLALSATIGMEDMMEDVIEIEIGQGMEQGEEIVNKESASEAISLIRKILKTAQERKAASH